MSSDSRKREQNSRRSQRFRQRAKVKREVNNIVAEAEKYAGGKLIKKWCEDIAAFYERQRQEKARAQAQVELAAVFFPEGPQRDKFRRDNYKHTKVHVSRTRHEMRDRMERFERAEEEDGNLADEARADNDDWSPKIESIDDLILILGRAQVGSIWWWEVALWGDGGLCDKRRGDRFFDVNYIEIGGRKFMRGHYRRPNSAAMTFLRAERRWHEAGPHHSASVTARPELLAVLPMHMTLPFRFKKQRGKVILPTRKPAGKVACNCKSKGDCVYLLDPSMCSRRAGCTPNLRPQASRAADKPVMSARGWDTPIPSLLHMTLKILFLRKINDLAIFFRPSVTGFLPGPPFL